MLKLKKIAITGGVASGKSSACRFFRELGAYVVNADALVHELLESNADLTNQIVQALGDDIIREGKISRKALAETVFRDSKKLQVLERLLHPAVLKRVEELYLEASRRGDSTVFVVEIPLLFEIGNEGFYDEIIAVLSEESIARKRFENAGFASTEYERRMRRQINPNQKAVRADYVLHNNGTLEELRNQVALLYQKILT